MGPWRTRLVLRREFVVEVVVLTLTTSLEHRSGCCRGWVSTWSRVGHGEGEPELTGPKDWNEDVFWSSKAVGKWREVHRRLGLWEGNTCTVRLEGVLLVSSVPIAGPGFSTVLPHQAHHSCCWCSYITCVNTLTFMTILLVYEIDTIFIVF